MKYVYQGREIYPQVEMYHDVIPYIGGISDKEFYTDPKACIEAWRKANAAMSEFFCGYFQSSYHKNFLWPVGIHQTMFGWLY